MTTPIAALPDRPFGPTGVERRSPRSSPRLKAECVPSIKGILAGVSGPRMELINISATGALIEGPERLKPGSEVRLVFEGDFSPPIVPSRVVRTSVTGIGRDGALRYQVGLAFLSPIGLPAAGDHASGEQHDAPREVRIEDPVVLIEQLCTSPDPPQGRPRNRW